MKELRQINDRGGIKYNHNGKTYKFMPLILSCCCDLPAKADLQGLIGHSGYFGCGFCFHPGISVAGEKKSVIRYVQSTINYEIRTHSSMIETYRALKSAPIKGVKSKSCLVAAKDFDLIFDFPIDYMHCVLLGVMKKLLNLWMDSSNHSKDFYINKKNQTTLKLRVSTND